jgi:hypothetical protein
VTEDVTTSLLTLAMRRTGSHCRNTRIHGGTVALRSYDEQRLTGKPTTTWDPTKAVRFRVGNSDSRHVVKRENTAKNHEMRMTPNLNKRRSGGKPS